MDGVTLLSPSRFLIGGLIISAFLTTLLRYMLSIVKPSTGKICEETHGQPPLAPKALPLLGHTPIGFLSDPLGFSHTYVGHVVPIMFDS